MTDNYMVIDIARRGTITKDPRTIAAARTMEMRGLVRVYSCGGAADFFRLELTAEGVKAYGRRRPSRPRGPVYQKDPLDEGRQ
jgi:hypothetical protein